MDLYLKIDAVALYLPGRTVKYCGTTTDERIYWSPPEASVPNRATLVMALCLNTDLVDLEGRDLYGIRHSLETVETYAEQTRAVRPLAQRLQDRARLVAAVEATLGPLADAEKIRAH